MLSSIFREKGPNSQLIDPFAEWELERSSLPELRQFIADVWAKDEDAAKQISGFVADPIEIGQFVETIFRHAKIGYVQLRMFVDGERKRHGDGPGRRSRCPTNSY